MTTTKTRPIRTREEELAEQLQEHRGQVAQLEGRAAELDDGAFDLDAKVDAKVTSLEGSLTALPGDLQELRERAQRDRQTATDLRARAQAYAARVELQAIAAEHDQLRQERIAFEQLEAATKEAKALIAEAENRAAWLFRKHIETEAVKRRYDEIARRLVELAGDAVTNVVIDQRRPEPDRPAASGARPSINVQRFTTLGNEVQQRAGQYVQAINRDRDPEFWRANLPELDPTLMLPEELRAPVAITSPATSQRTAEAFDPDVPKDRAMRLAAGAQPLARKPDGTPIDSAPINLVGRLTTEAEDRRRRKEIAASLEAEDAVTPAIAVKAVAGG